jgi:hypothetical protein
MNVAKRVIRILLWKQKKTSNYNGNKVSRIRCYFCGNIGHIRRNCKKRKSSSTTSKDESKDEAFICETLNAEQDDVWIADSEATDHVTHRKEWFSALKFFEVPIKVHIGNKSTMDALGKGIIHFEALVNGC